MRVVGELKLLASQEFFVLFDLQICLFRVDFGRDLPYFFHLPIDLDLEGPEHFENQGRGYRI